VPANRFFEVCSFAKPFSSTGLSSVSLTFLGLKKEAGIM